MSPTLKYRILTAVFGIPLIIFLLLMKGWYVQIPATLLTLIGVYEFQKAFQLAGFKPIVGMGYLMTIALMATYIFSSQFSVPLVMLLIVLFYVLLAYHVVSSHSIVDVFITVFSVVYVAIPFILILSLSKRQDYLLWLVFAIAFLSDSFAYFAGKAFGKRKLIEKVSPNKTIEGALGGIVGSLLGTIVFKYWLMPELSLPFVIALGIAGSMASILGDLTASKIKRYCNIKDFGHLFPGHGGVLDRFDSILFTAPVIFVFAWAISIL
jgi:phosphatidate cytidylyltransferase